MKKIWLFKIWQHFLLLWKHHLQNHADNTTNPAIFKYWYSLGFYGLKYTLWFKFSRDKSFRYHSVAALKNRLWPQSHSHRQISGAIFRQVKLILFWDIYGSKIRKVLDPKRYKINLFTNCMSLDLICLSCWLSYNPLHYTE